jgi:hypothetical protein
MDRSVMTITLNRYTCRSIDRQQNSEQAAFGVHTSVLFTAQQHVRRAKKQHYTPAECNATEGRTGEQLMLTTSCAMVLRETGTAKPLEQR